ncbi:histidine phosphatase family protein [Gardnerella vaginalis]|nr:histidine phosphatase family protein [Gardnerella vaginalis]
MEVGLEVGLENMPATTIHFVRHGEVENPNHVLYERLPGFHLSNRGLKMAQATAKYIATVPQMRGISAIYSSPLERTQETAQQIANALQIGPIILDNRLIEAENNFRGKRIGYGEGALWKNNNWKLVSNLWKPSWGESYKSIAARVGDFAREQVKNHPGEQIVAVTHESPIWSYRHLLETGHAEHNMLLRKTALASITSITYDCTNMNVLSITYVDPAARVQ